MAKHVKTELKLKCEPNKHTFKHIIKVYEMMA